MFWLTHNNSFPAKLYELSLIEEEKTFYLSNSCLCDQNSPVVKTATDRWYTRRLR